MTPEQLRRSRKRNNTELPRGPGENPFVDPLTQEEEDQRMRDQIRSAGRLTARARSDVPTVRSRGKRMSERHHALARIICQGAPLTEAAAAVGYEYGEVKDLVDKDPSFQGLLDMYNGQAMEVFKDFHARSYDVVMEATRRISERLEKDEEVPLKELNEVYRVFADRTGHAPTTTSVSVNVSANMGDRLEQARLRAKEAARTIDHQPQEKDNA